MDKEEEQNIANARIMLAKLAASQIISEKGKPMESGGLGVGVSLNKGDTEQANVMTVDLFRKVTDDLLNDEKSYNNNGQYRSQAANLNTFKDASIEELRVLEEIVKSFGASISHQISLKSNELDGSK